MSDVTREIVYFGRPGSSNTAKTLEVARRRASELGVKSVVVASTTGETGLKALKLFKGFNLVVVSHVTGFSGPNYQGLTEERRAQILTEGGRVVTMTHGFGGAGRAVRRKFGAVQVDEIMANVLKLFGEGVKVAVEVALMAADTGLVRVNEEVVAIGGSGGGCDSALVLTPANVHSLFDLRIHEVICKPRLSGNR